MFCIQLYRNSRKTPAVLYTKNFKVFEDNKDLQDNLKKINYDFSFELHGSKGMFYV